jgi:hypothetical protein
MLKATCYVNGCFCKINALDFAGVLCLKHILFGEI